MSLAAFKRLGFAAWLVAIALIANLAAQNQLSVNVVAAAAERAAASPQPTDPHAHHRHMAEGQGHQGHHAAPEPVAVAHDHGASHHGTGHHGAGGHTHKGHADCAVCGVAADMAALTLPATLVVDTPRDFAATEQKRIVEVLHTTARYSPYASRAPPVSL